jgi:hypothetical protein
MFDASNVVNSAWVLITLFGPMVTVPSPATVSRERDDYDPWNAEKRRGLRHLDQCFGNILRIDLTRIRDKEDEAAIEA